MRQEAIGRYDCSFPHVTQNNLFDDNGAYGSSAYLYDRQLSGRTSVRLMHINQSLSVPVKIRIRNDNHVG